jgi:hypothetical protein
MILCVPTVGQKVRVLDGQEWKFHLIAESRNYSTIQHFHPGAQGEGYYEHYDLPEGVTYYDFYSQNGRAPDRKKYPTTLPGGTVLTIDRIYLRKGKDEYDSITFILNKPKGVKGPMVRFWVRLDEVNAGKLELLPLEK